MMKEKKREINYSMQYEIRSLDTIFLIYDADNESGLLQICRKSNSIQLEERKE